MKPTSPPPQQPTLLELLRDLLEAALGLRPLPSASSDDPRKPLLLLLETKLIPELESNLSLPVFIGVQGGTNTGKSMVFNALAGRLLSPSMVLASATKHPLVYLHEDWKSRFLSTAVFPRLECRELADPRELIVDAEREDILYFRFHQDPGLRSIALMDSPDFDSALASNALQATRIAAISDVTLFVTTAQKYKDRLLVEQLESLLAMKANVIVVWNMVEEPIVFETLLDDLRASLPAGHREFQAIRLPSSRTKYPEDELREKVSAEVLRPLLELKADQVKPRVISCALQGAMRLVETLLSGYSAENEFKREILDLARREGEGGAAAYKSRFSLSFPEETLAVRRVLAVTELGRKLEIAAEVEKVSKVLGLMGSSIRKLNETLRRLMVRLARSDEGLIESTPAALKEYGQARDQADFENVLRLTESLRVKVESFVRSKEEISALARTSMRTFFTPELATGFPERIREAHSKALRSTGRTGEEILPCVESWLQKNPFKVRVLALSTVTFKLGAGLALAWALPPSQGILALLSPVKWIYFAVGYFLGAYLVALLVSWRVRKHRSLVAARFSAMEATLRDAFLDPLKEALDGIVTDYKLRKVRALARQIKEHALPAAALTARDQSPPCPAGGSAGGA